MTNAEKKTAWRDSCEEVQDRDGEVRWQFDLVVTAEEDPPHSFVATLTVSEWVQKEGTSGNLRADWELGNPQVVHRSEHTSVVAAARTLKKAEKRARLLRVGPDHD